MYTMNLGTRVQVPRFAFGIFYFLLLIDIRTSEVQFSYCFLQGIRNSGVPKHIFQHNDPLDLEKKLQKVSSQLMSLVGRHISLVPTVKWTVPRDFRLQVFFRYQIPSSSRGFPFSSFRIFQNLGDIRSWRSSTGVLDTGGKWKKSSIWKAINILFGHVWVMELK